MRRIASIAGVPALAALGTAGLVGTAPPAGAGGGYVPGDELVADYTGDGRPDRILLADAGGDLCAVVVQPGQPDGSFGQAEVHTYTDPGDPADTSYGRCPDTGIVLDLGGDGDNELVVSWLFPRHDVPDSFMVLDGFRPAPGGIASGVALEFPSVIGTADFDGDGVLDVYAWTDQGDGFASYLNTTGGTLVPGPVEACHGSSAHSLADFDEDGATDIAFTYYEGCPGVPPQGVAVVLDDGTRVQLEGDDSTDYSHRVADVDGDGHLDVEVTVTGGDVRTWRGNGDGTFVAPK